MPTRIAVISDCHADWQALTDALAQIDRLNCKLIVCAGDLVDWGLFPNELLDLLRQRRIPCIRGNHDRWAVDSAGDFLIDTSGWDISPVNMRFLASLPQLWFRIIEGVRVAMHHGRPGSDLSGIYPDMITAEDARRCLDAAGANVLLVGHTHIAFRFEVKGRGVIANPGALLRDRAAPLDEPMVLDPTTGKFVLGPTACPGTFGVLDLPSCEFQVFRAKNGAPAAMIRRNLG